jgi:glutaminase
MPSDRPEAAQRPRPPAPPDAGPPEPSRTPPAGTGPREQAGAAAAEEAGPAGGPGEDLGFYRRLFDSFGKDAGGRVSRREVASRFRQAGITPDDPRTRESWKALQDAGGEDRGLDFERFTALCRPSSRLIARAVRSDFVIPDFAAFTADITEIFDSLAAHEEGAVAAYIPQLKRVDPGKFAISVCTVDGQQFSIGDADAAFCVQSVCKPINYCLTLQEHGSEVVHRHVGREPSGLGFNELSVNADGLPHNPMINSGAIMSCSLIQPGLDMADRFDFVADTWRRLSAGGYVGFNNAVYLSERQTADRNFALGYFMREHGAFPPGTDLIETLEFYFQCCSIEINSKGLGVVAASLANGGMVPLTGDRVFSADSVKKALSLMSSCGMYDYSGEFAFTIGLPAKSGVSGALMLVVPQAMGICVWSPRLDTLGNSVRGIEFCRQLVDRYNFHVYDALADGGHGGKRDPRRKRNQSTIEGPVRLLWSASQGDLEDVRAALIAGVDANACDYDGRTALHLAASEGRLDVVRYLLERGARPGALDRWGGTPLADAQRGGHAQAEALLRAAGESAAPPEALGTTA